MKSKYSTFFCLILSATIASITYTQIASANPVDTSSPSILSSGAANANVKTMRVFETIKMDKSHGVNLGLNRNKNLTSNDAQIIIQAALLEKGRKDLHVGDVSSLTNHKGVKVYQVDIKDQQNKLISQVWVNSRNGKIHPAPMQSA